MNATVCHADILRDLELRQNDLLKQLDALDHEVQTVLNEHLGKRTASDQDSPQAEAVQAQGGRQGAGTPKSGVGEVTSAGPNAPIC